MLNVDALLFASHIDASSLAPYLDAWSLAPYLDAWYKTSSGCKVRFAPLGYCGVGVYAHPRSCTSSRCMLLCILLDELIFALHLDALFIALQFVLHITWMQLYLHFISMHGPLHFILVHCSLHLTLMQGPLHTVRMQCLMHASMFDARIFGTPAQRRACNVGMCIHCTAGGGAGHVGACSLVTVPMCRGYRPL